VVAINPKTIRFYIAVYQGYLAHGRMPPSEQAVDEKARGHIAFGPKDPASAVILKCEFDTAVHQLPPALEEVVWARIDAGSLGRAARRLKRRKKEVCRDFDAAVEMLADSPIWESVPPEVPVLVP
jgi:hypothetical protein